MFSPSKSLIKKFPQLSQYKPGLDFLTRLFFILLFLFLIKKLYSWQADSNGMIHTSLGTFSLIEPLRHFLLYSTKFILHLLGYDPHVYGWIVGIPGGGIIIETPCLGINICFIFIALVSAYPSAYHWYAKVFYIVSGVMAIQFLNICRMVAMVLVVKNRYELPIEHHDLFNIIIYCFIFFLFYLFINRNEAKKYKELV